MVRCTSAPSWRSVGSITARIFSDCGDRPIFFFSSSAFSTAALCVSAGSVFYVTILAPFKLARREWYLLAPVVLHHVGDLLVGRLRQLEFAVQTHIAGHRQVERIASEFVFVIERANPA